MPSPALRRRSPAGLALALVLLAASCGDDEDPTLDAEVIRARCLAEAPPALKTTIAGGRWLAEPCGDGPCDRRLTIESTCVTYETRGPDGEILQLNHGILTADGRARGAAIADELLDVDLPGLWDRCKDDPCGSRSLALVRAGEGSLHQLRGEVPPALIDAAAHLDALRAALAHCDTDPQVTVIGRCERE